MSLIDRDFSTVTRYEAAPGTRGPYTRTSTSSIADQSAQLGIDYFRQTLALWGLDSPSLIAWADEQLRSGASVDKILFDLEQRPEFKAAFPEIEARRNKMTAAGNPLSPIGPGEILEYRTQAKALMRSFGLPPEYYDNPDVTFNLIVNDKSLAELNDSLDLLQKRVANAPPEVGAVFDQVFGANSRQAMFLAFTNDQVTLPALEDMVQTAEAGGAARRFGFGLSENEMQRVADANLGYEQLVSGFGTLDEQRALFDETISEGTDLTVGGAGIEAAFGLGGTGRQELERRAKSRTAATAGIAGELTENRGAVGLGEAGRR